MKILEITDLSKVWNLTNFILKVACILGISISKNSNSLIQIFSTSYSLVINQDIFQKLRSGNIWDIRFNNARFETQQIHYNKSWNFSKKK